ncbi:MAG: phytoene/squalene synthase family protein [Parvularculaceae bacterium]|nr:phytoene/squalene synthase family protein [Parvularculaceae bacterium]
MTPTPADVEACAAAIRGGSKTFFAASMLLPKETRLGAYAVYAFCRYSDDAIDVAGGDRTALENLRQRLALIFEGRPADHFADRAFANAIRRFDIPRALPEALLEGFEWDVDKRRYQTLGELEAYAARVAGAVGAIMACLMGARSRAAIARASDLGTAMQLTNIARDVGEDARAGRLYLPLDMMAAEGLDTDGFLAAPRHTRALGAVIHRLLGRAGELYARGAAGIAYLPSDCRAAIGAAGLIYSDIGREIAARNHDSVSTRAVVSKGRKLALLGKALVGAPQDAALRQLPPLAANEFLVDAAYRDAPEITPSSNFDDQLAGVIDLFSRLEQRERMHGAPAY